MYEAVIELPGFTYRFVTDSSFYEGDEVTFTVYKDDECLGTFTRRARYNSQYGVYFSFRGYAISDYDFQSQN